VIFSILFKNLIVQTEVSENIDILENEIIQKYPGVLELLLIDQTTKKNIFWATENYQHLGNAYHFNSNILPENITGGNGNIIMPRVKKHKTLQVARSKEMAEVFTPSWVCNAQNNLIDKAWFQSENIFNTEIQSSESKTWKVNQSKIIYPKGKVWKDYVKDIRLEMACGEAPYIVSRYDSTSGEFIPIDKRIGLLDRKLRVINENVEDSGEWLEAAQTAYKSIYGYEWQGDSLLLARESLLITFIENYQHKFNKSPFLKSIKSIASIISWNIWQMDGIKGVIPNSCKTETNEIEDLFGSITFISIECEGCKTGNIKKHNGKYTVIRDWNQQDLQSRKNKKSEIKFIDLIK
jgi:hypothetical protein